MSQGLQILLILGVLVLGLAVGYLIKHYQLLQADKKKKTEGDRILATAKEEARSIELEPSKVNWAQAFELPLAGLITNSVTGGRVRSVQNDLHFIDV